MYFQIGKMLILRYNKGMIEEADVIHKHDINVKRDDFSTVLGKTYMKMCTWMPWGALILILGATILDTRLDKMIIYLVATLLMINALYLGYKFLVYKQSEGNVTND